jgi:hypothetical protein
VSVLPPATRVVAAPSGVPARSQTGCLSFRLCLSQDDTSSPRSVFALNDSFDGSSDDDEGYSLPVVYGGARRQGHVNTLEKVEGISGSKKRKQGKRRHEGGPVL